MSQFVIARVEYCLRMLVYILLLDGSGKLHTTLTISSVCKHQDLEGHFIAFFKHMRLWPHYSMLNSVMKRKYGSKIQDFPRVTMLIKGFPEDLKQKAHPG